MTINVTIHAEMQALQLWAEWFKDGGHPFIMRSNRVDFECFFCEAEAYHADELAHIPSCVYIRAKALLEEIEALMKAHEPPEGS